MHAAAALEVFNVNGGGLRRECGGSGSQVGTLGETHCSRPGAADKEHAAVIAGGAEHVGAGGGNVNRAGPAGRDILAANIGKRLSELSAMSGKLICAVAAETVGGKVESCVGFVASKAGLAVPPGICPVA